MALKNKFVKALEILFSNDSSNFSLTSKQNLAKENIVVNDAQKIRELQNVVYGLNSKMIILTKKVHELNDQIINLTTINEELLYALDQGFNQHEDKEVSVGLNFKPKKYELN